MHRHTAAALLILAALAAASCAPRQTAEPLPMEPIAQRSPEATAAFNFLKFEDARRSGRLADAMAALEILLQLDQRPELYQKGADLHWRMGNAGEARALLKRGLTVFPSSRLLAVGLANTYYAEKRHEDAIGVLQDYLERTPEDWNTYKDMALIHLDAGLHAEAIEDLKNIPEEHRSAPILYYWAKASAGLGLTNQARDLLRRATDMDSFFMEAWAELAYLYEVDGNFLDAEKVYTRLLDLGETGSEVHLRLISLNLKLNKPDRALAIYRRGPSEPDYALEAATLFLDEKFYEQARAVLIPLSETPDAPVRMWFHLAVLAYEGDRDATQAIEYLERIPADDRLFHRAARFRIHLLLDLGEADQSVALIRELKATHPDQSAYYLLEANYYQRESNFNKALEILTEATAKWPEDTELLYSQGIVLEKLDRRDEGLDVMETIITIDADHADALNYVGYLLADENRDLERAMVLITRALELEPDNGYILDSMAWVHYRRGNLDKAWELMQRAVEHVADEPTIWEHYGEIADELGFKDKAREGYRNSLELAPGNEAIQRKIDEL